MNAFRSLPLPSPQMSLDEAFEVAETVAPLPAIAHSALQTFVRHIASSASAHASRCQRAVGTWAERCFGDRIAPKDRLKERALRVLEEANELAQSVGVDADLAAQIQRYVYARTPGDPVQELGGVRVTLLAFAEEAGLSAHDAERTEIARILSRDPALFRVRNCEKAAAGVGLYVP